jgi:hypothetical protein
MGSLHRRFDSSAAPALELANAIRRTLQREALQEPSEQYEPDTEPVAAIGGGPDPQVAVALETVEGFLANLTALCLERLAPAAEFSLPFDRATLTALRGHKPPRVHAQAPRARTSPACTHKPRVQFPPRAHCTALAVPPYPPRARTGVLAGFAPTGAALRGLACPILKCGTARQSCALRATRLWRQSWFRLYSQPLPPL